jgi:hypothetical protein
VIKNPAAEAGRKDRLICRRLQDVFSFSCFFSQLEQGGNYTVFLKNGKFSPLMDGSPVFLKSTDKA